MEADRQLREEQYAAQREKDWEDTLRREAEIHRYLARIPAEDRIMSVCLK